MAPSETFLRLHELSRKSRGAEYMDAAALPSASHLEREFGLFNPEGSGCCPTVDATGAVTCTCSGCERWSKYVAGTLGERWPTYKQYEVLTTEYVAQLARYLRSRRSEIIGDDVVGEPLRSLRVLELGAGDGRLTRHLREELDGHSVEVYATDDHSLGLARGSAHGVVAADALNAIALAGGAARSPIDGSSNLPAACDVALVCWQPMGVDWTAAVRASASFQEYLLIGEADDGICGHRRLTWGLEDDDDDAGDSEDDGNGEGAGRARAMPSYVTDGWTRVDVTDELGGRQICRTDERWLSGRRSRSISFRRGAACVESSGVF